MGSVLNILYTYTPLKFYVQSFWRDEAFSYLMARQNVPQILLTTAHDANPPLYYLLMHVWMMVFGSGEVAMRTLSFIFFIGTLYVVGLFLMDAFRFRLRKALIYLALFAVNPLLHYYAFEARMYSMFAFFSTLSFYFLHKKNYLWYTIACILGLYTHYFMAVCLLAQIVYVYVFEGNSKAKIKKAVLIITAFFAPWLTLVIVSKPPLGEGFWIPKLTLNTFLNLPALFLTGYEDLIGFPYKQLPFISAFFTVFFIYAGYLLYSQSGGNLRPQKKSSDKLLFLFCTWTVVPAVLILIMSLFKPVFLPRYNIFITVGFLLLFIRLLKLFNRKTKLIILTVAFIFSLHYGSVQIVSRTKADIRKPLKEIKNLMGKKDVVYVLDPYNFHPAQYYIDDSSVFIYGKSYDSLPWYIGKILIPEDKIVSSLPLYPRKAFILQDETSYSIQAIY